MKFVLWITALTIIALAAHTGFAQNPPSPPDPASMAQHQVQFLTTLLSLTSSQQQQALAIFTSAATSESTLREEDKTAHQALDAAVQANDSAAITQAATVIGNLATQRTELHAKADAAVYELLSPAQQSKFAAFKAQGPGPGGPGGPLL